MEAPLAGEKAREPRSSLDLRNESRKMRPGAVDAPRDHDGRMDDGDYIRELLEQLLPRLRLARDIWRPFRLRDREWRTVVFEDRRGTEPDKPLQSSCAQLTGKRHLTLAVHRAGACTVLPRRREEHC